MRRRQGFTITELLVSMALIIFIMMILTEAFSAGLETFRQLKAIGDMQERLRTATVVLRQDLQARHFGEGPGRLSDQKCNLAYTGEWQPPLTGYFRIRQQPPPAAENPGAVTSGINNSTHEGDEPTGSVAIPSVRATRHALQFTCFLQTQKVGREHFRSVTVPPGSGLENQGPVAYQSAGVMNTRWYEVCYFLRPLNDATGAALTTAGSPAIPRFALYRRERAISEDAGAQNINLGAVHEDISTTHVNRNAGATETVNRPSDVPDPRCRFMSEPTNGNTVQPAHAGIDSTAHPFPNWSLADVLPGQPARHQDDLLLTDVLSFDIKVLQQGWDPTTQTIKPNNGLFPIFVDLPPASIPYHLDASNNTMMRSANSVFSAANLSVFDTWCQSASRMFPPEARAANAHEGWPYFRDKARGVEGWWPELNGSAVPPQPYHLPLPIRIYALQITIRIWDAKTEQTRQVTIIQDM